MGTLDDIKNQRQSETSASEEAIRRIVREETGEAVKKALRERETPREELSPGQVRQIIREEFNGGAEDWTEALRKGVIEPLNSTASAMKTAGRTNQQAAASISEEREAISEATKNVAGQVKREMGTARDASWKTVLKWTAPAVVATVLLIATVASGTIWVKTGRLPWAGPTEQERQQRTFEQSEAVKMQRVRDAYSVMSDRAKRRFNQMLVNAEDKAEKSYKKPIIPKQYVPEE